MPGEPNPPQKDCPGRKSILLFSDGTGNSSGKLFKTNVWRLYRAVDLSEYPTIGDRQIASYDDGVGTSAFLPLRLLGGAFGVGLSRNVLDLYRFACRNYVPGDRIYAFGFSRGAFTVRVLIGLICEMGLVQADNEVELDRLTRSAYREYRRCFRLAGNRPLRGAQNPATAPEDRKAKTWDLTSILVDPLRRLRDRIFPLPAIVKVPPGADRADANSIDVGSIAFVGVWDTVAAYGTPLAEVTRAIDRWVWPLSMPNYTLSSKVEVARHALALDDERDTFHPLLWDELEEDRLLAAEPERAERLRQVWFPGMHADVGGGYADDSLAHVPLAWMLDEAKAAGLRLKPAEEAALKAVADPFGPMHDSRAGFASYYRYQPRKLSARLDPTDETTLTQQDPELGGRGLLSQVVLHSSVVRRIAAGIDAYAPIVLPSAYTVLYAEGIERLPVERAEAQERVWDDVWLRRLNFFATVAVTLVLVLLPLVEEIWPAGACIGPQCVVGPWFRSASAILPGLVNPWLDAFAMRPGTVIAIALILLALRKRSTILECRLRGRMRKILRFSQRGTSTDRAELVETEAEKRSSWRIRSSRRYQAVVQNLKWRFAPAFFGALFLFCIVAGVVIAIMLSLAAGHRFHLAIAERRQWQCNGMAVSPGNALFATNQPCWIAPGKVVKGHRYQLQMRVVEPWRDGSIPASPVGFPNSEMPWRVRLFAPLLRRSINDPWFRPLVAIRGRGMALGGVKAVRMRPADCDCGMFVGEFEAPASGQPVLAVNDAVFLWGGIPHYFYVGGPGANAGTAQVTIVDHATNQPIAGPDRPSSGITFLPGAEDE